MFEHADRYQELDLALPLAEKIGVVHTNLRRSHPSIERISVATYDATSDLVSTLTGAGDDSRLLAGYSTRLAATPALRNILTLGRPRIVNDMDLFAGGKGEHTLKVGAASYRASYTVAMRYAGELFGFVFFNSRRRNAFSDSVLDDLDSAARIISLLVLREYPDLVVSQRR